MSFPAIEAFLLPGTWLKAAAGVMSLALGVVLAGCDSHRVIEAETIDGDFSDVVPASGAPCLQDADGMARADCAATGPALGH